MLRSFHHISLRIAYRAPQRVLTIFESCRTSLSLLIMAKRKRSTVAATAEAPVVDAPKTLHTAVPLPSNVATNAPKPACRQASRGGKGAPTNPDTNPDVLDGVSALRASPDGHEDGEPESHLAPNMSNGTVNGAATEAPAAKSKRKKAAMPQVKVEPEESKSVNRVAKNKPVPSENTIMADDPEAEEGLEEDEVEIKEALSRPPPVNSEYLPLPWKGRLGYVWITSVLRAVPLTVT
jgi:UV DNA damage endonuclease